MQSFSICYELKFFETFVVGKTSGNEIVVRVRRSRFANVFNLSG